MRIRYGEDNGAGGEDELRRLLLFRCLRRRGVAGRGGGLTAFRFLERIRPITSSYLTTIVSSSTGYRDSNAGDKEGGDKSSDDDMVV